MTEALAITVAYLLGSVPTGFLLTQALKHRDIRDIGSGSTGATNIRRVLGTKWGIVVALVDVLKGVAAILIARQLDVSPAVVGLAGAAAVAGHCWPVWLGFKGGKGVATGGGAAFALGPWGFVLIPIMVLPIAISRYVSLGSVLAALAMPLVFATAAVFEWTSWDQLWFAVPACIIIVWRHRDNIGRLLEGNERKLGTPKPTTATQ